MVLMRCKSMMVQVWQFLMLDRQNSLLPLPHFLLIISYAFLMQVIIWFMFPNFSKLIMSTLSFTHSFFVWRIKERGQPWCTNQVVVISTPFNLESSILRPPFPPPVTHYVCLYLLKTKSEIALIFPQFDAKLEKMFPHKIKLIYTDGGIKYIKL